MTAAIPRRDRLCDAAISVIARTGLRGLTHRAVDQEAGLPQGSASYYFRTRAALLAAVTHRLVEADLADAAALELPGGAEPGLEAANPVAVDSPQVVDFAVGIVAHLTGHGRDRMLARYEISLQATRQPELRHSLLTAGARLRALAARLLAAAGATAPERQGRDLVACIDGLVYDQLAGAGGLRTSDDLRATLREIISGMLPGGFEQSTGWKQ